MKWQDDGLTPAAVIASGTTARQRCVTADLSRIAAISEEASIQSPAILWGDVVSLKEEVDWQQLGPLSGKKILVTATEIVAEPLAEHIRRWRRTGSDEPDFGAEPRKCMDKEGADSSGKRWLVFTKQKRCRFFFEQMKRTDGY